MALYGPTAASKIVTERSGRRVAPSTVRNWTVTYGAFLSDLAAPTAAGQRRELNDRDVDVLTLIARLRREGMHETVIIDRLPEALAQLDAGAAEPSQTPTAAADEPPQLPAVRQDLADAVTALQAAAESTRLKREDIDDLQQRMRRVETVMLYGAGAVILLLLLIVLVLVFTR